MSFYISAFYCFFNNHKTPLEKQKQDFVFEAEKNSVKGLVILSQEGINCTFSAPTEQARQDFELFVQKYFSIQCEFKHSESEFCPFKRFSVKIRDEIVTLNRPGLIPNESQNHHLSPEEWNLALQEQDVVVIDTRNWYETNIGTFKGALVPPIKQFTDFPKYFEEKGIPKDKKALIFCTGGIRCEKGILDLQEKGYKNVYQLQGGILNYLKEFPNEKFEGECFVFDNRVAVDQNLQPTTTYKLCPHCGQPAKKTVICKRCDTEAYVCDSCQELPVKQSTCSKNCAHWYAMDPSKKGPRQISDFLGDCNKVPQ